jgi:High potential iron-sulfur protein
MCQTIDRRDLLKCVLVSAVILPALAGTEAWATDLPPLDLTDPVAQSLDFVPDASKQVANSNSSFKPGQHCGVCMQFQGKAADARAACTIYAGHSVPSSGWCRAFAQR